MAVFEDTGFVAVFCTSLKIIIRMVWVTAINLYSIPSYLVWMLILRPVLWINDELYWKIEGYLFRWLLYMAAHWSWSAGYTITECGDDISMCTEEETLLLVNHQSTADVPLLMQSFSKKGMAPNRMMWIMDVLFKYTHFGAVSSVRGDFFIQQGKDTRHLQGALLEKHMINSYWPRGRQWLILFPEGGFLWKRRQASQEFAKKNGLPILEHVTLPRIGAMQTMLKISHDTNNHDRSVKNTPNGPQSITKGVKKPIKWVIDLTVGYEKGKPLDLQTIFAGYRKPCDTKFHYRKYPASSIPLDSENLTNWLYDRYVEKEHLLHTLYQTGKFPDEAVFGEKNIAPRMVTFTLLDFLPLHLFFIASFYLFATNMYAVIANICMLVF